jgi:hypothetical protein
VLKNYCTNIFMQVRRSQKPGQYQFPSPENKKKMETNCTTAARKDKADLAREAKAA